jgi:hypothetical protein
MSHNFRVECPQIYSTDVDDLSVIVIFGEMERRHGYPGGEGQMCA